MMNVAVDFFENLNAIDNWGNGSSLEYQSGHFWEAVKLIVNFEH